MDDPDIVVAEPLHPLGGERGELAVPLDRDHAAGDPAHHRRRVARARADLEHRRLPARSSAAGDHQRDDIGLRDGLPGLDRQRRVLIGAGGQLFGHERLARHLAHRVEQPLVVDPAAGDLAPDHLLA